MASFLQFLLLYCLSVSLCNGQTRQPWSTICPDDTCQEIVLSRINKATKTFTLNSFKEKHVFCLKPLTGHSLKGIGNVWYNYRISIATNSTNGSSLYPGNSSSTVLSILQGKGTSNGLWQYTSGKEGRVTEVRSSPYKVQCVGVKLIKGGNKGGKVTIYFTQSFQIGFVVLFLLGVFLFISSPYFTKNTAFYYSGGIAIGVVASLLILLYIFSKFVPKKNILGLGVLVGGYTFAGYLAHWIYSQGVEFVKENWFYLLIYSIGAGLISFAVLYRIGPAHPRSLQLIQWFLQLVGLGLVFLSFFQFYEIGILVVIMVLSWYNMPLSISGRVKQWFLNCSLSHLFASKQQRRLLTLEEYEEQGQVETEKALDELRRHCQSSGSKFWEEKLQDLQNHSQTKFLEFLSGKDHVTDRERDVHEVEFPSAYDDDSSSSEEDSFPSSTSSPYLSSRNTSLASSPSPRHYYYS